MNEHTWLTEKQVEYVECKHGYGWGVRRLIADWREMRELLLSCEDQLPAWREREDIEDMREATGND